MRQLISAVVYLHENSKCSWTYFTILQVSRDKISFQQALAKRS